VTQTPWERSGGRSTEGRPARVPAGNTTGNPRGGPWDRPRDDGEDATQAIPVVEQTSRTPGEDPSWAERTSPTRGVGRPAPAPAGQRVEPRPARGSRRRAHLSVRRIDPWSVFVTSLIVSLFLGVVLLVAVGVLYALLDAVGVLESVNDLLATIGVTDEGTAFVGLGKVLGISAVVAAVDVVLITVLATLFAFLYNVVASLTGGVVMTLSEGE
jgi:hypothetical protein